MWGVWLAVVVMTTFWGSGCTLGRVMVCCMVVMGRIMFCVADGGNGAMRLLVSRATGCLACWWIVICTAEPGCELDMDVARGLQCNKIMDE